MVDPLQTFIDIITGQAITDAQVVIETKMIARHDQSALLCDQSPDQFTRVDLSIVAHESDRGGLWGYKADQVIPFLTPCLKVIVSPAHIFARALQNAGVYFWR